MTHHGIIGPTVQYVGQVNLTTNRTNDTSKRVNTMYFLLQFLQKIGRILRRNQINLVKNYNILQQTTKLIRLEVQHTHTRTDRQQIKVSHTERIR